MIFLKHYFMSQYDRKIYVIYFVKKVFGTIKASYNTTVYKSEC